MTLYLVRSLAMGMVAQVSLDRLLHDALECLHSGSGVFGLVAEDELFAVGEEGQGIVVGLEFVSEEDVSQVVGSGPVVEGLLDARGEQLFLLVGGRQGLLHGVDQSPLVAVSLEVVVEGQFGLSDLEVEHSLVGVEVDGGLEGDSDSVLVGTGYNIERGQYACDLFHLRLSAAG